MDLSRNSVWMFWRKKITSIPFSHTTLKSKFQINKRSKCKNQNPERIRGKYRRIFLWSWDWEGLPNQELEPRIHRRKRWRDLIK